MNKAAFIAFSILVLSVSGCEYTKGWGDKMSDMGSSVSDSVKGAFKSEDKNNFVPPQMVLDKYPVISLNTQEIDVINKYEMSMQPPHVEHLFPVSLETTIKNLVDSKLLAMGEGTKLNVIIDDMSVIEDDYYSEDEKFMDKFKKQPDKVLKARIVLRFELVDINRPEVIMGHSTLVAKRNMHLMSGMSVSEQEKAYYDLTENLVDDINKGFQETVKRYFGMESF